LQASPIPFVGAWGRFGKCIVVDGFGAVYLSVFDTFRRALEELTNR
jgi:hypothetical protein